MRNTDRSILNSLEAIARSLIKDPLIFEYWSADGQRHELTIDEIIEREKKHSTGAQIFKVISGNNMKDLEKMLKYSRSKTNEYYTRESEPP